MWGSWGKSLQSKALAEHCCSSCHGNTQHASCEQQMSPFGRVWMSACGSGYGQDVALGVLLICYSALNLVLQSTGESPTYWGARLAVSRENMILGDERPPRATLEGMLTSWRRFNPSEPEPQWVGTCRLLEGQAWALGRAGQEAEGAAGSFREY